MIAQQPDSLLPFYPLPRMQKGSERMIAFLASYQAKYALRIAQGTIYGPIPLDMGIHFGRTVQLVLVPGHIDSVQWTSGPAVPDPLNPPVTFTADESTGGFFSALSDVAWLPNWQNEIPDEYVRVTTYFVAWTWLQFRLGESVFDCFNYRPRVGAGNFNNH